MAKKASGGKPSGNQKPSGAPKKKTRRGGRQYRKSQAKQRQREARRRESILEARVAQEERNTQDIVPGVQPREVIPEGEAGASLIDDLDYALDENATYATQRRAIAEIKLLYGLSNFPVGPTAAELISQRVQAIALTSPHDSIAMEAIDLLRKLTEANVKTARELVRIQQKDQPKVGYIGQQINNTENNLQINATGPTVISLDQARDYVACLFETEANKDFRTNDGSAEE